MPPQQRNYTDRRHPDNLETCIFLDQATAWPAISADRTMRGTQNVQFWTRHGRDFLIVV
jgi:hypothetical protein